MSEQENNGFSRPVLDVILGVLIPPVEVFRMKGVGMEFIISILLWLIPIASVLYCFHMKEIPLVVNILCALLPPVGVYMAKNECGKEALIALLLMFVFYLPGVIYAYLVV